MHTVASILSLPTLALQVLVDVMACILRVAVVDEAISNRVAPLGSWGCFLVTKTSLSWWEGSMRCSKAAPRPPEVELLACYAAATWSWPCTSSHMR